MRVNHIQKFIQGAEKQASGRQPRHYQFKAPGSKLIGKDSIRSTFGFQLRASSCLYLSIYKSHATPDHGLRQRFSTPCYQAPRAGSSANTTGVLGMEQSCSKNEHSAVSNGVRRLGKLSLFMDMRAFAKVQRLLL